MKQHPDVHRLCLECEEELEAREDFLFCPSEDCPRFGLVTLIVTDLDCDHGTDGFKN